MFIEWEPVGMEYFVVLLDSSKSAYGQSMNSKPFLGWESSLIRIMLLSFGKKTSTV